jgi:hypothetical protein
MALLPAQDDVELTDDAVDTSSTGTETGMDDV